jgi:glycosyltransferase involved in cell wall biosynthesis
MRVLHILGSLDRGGVETWLLHTVQHINRRDVEIGFALHSPRVGVLEERMRDMSIPIFRLGEPSLSAYNGYASRLRKVLRKFEPDIIHSHVHFYSGRVLQLAKRYGVLGRVAHSHTNEPIVRVNPVRRAYTRLSRRWVSRYATAGIAASPEAAANLFGPRWDADPRWMLLPCGIDLSEFKVDARTIRDGSSLRNQLGLPEDARVVGHVGRFVPAKNQQFIVEIAEPLMKKVSNVYFILVGRGPLRDSIENDIRRRGLSDHCLVLGERNDVPDLMLRLFDLFLLPSLYEGLGMSVLEAQAAGVPSIVSNRVSRSVAIVPDLVQFLPLAGSRSLWVGAIAKAFETAPPVSQQIALRRMEDSPANIELCVQHLERLYRRAMHQGSDAVVSETVR